MCIRDKLKDAGFTLNFRGYSNADEVVKALDAAQKVGVKIIAACPELRNDTEATVKRFMKHPALAGYCLRDEPLSSDFPALGEMCIRDRPECHRDRPEHVRG